MAKGIERFEKLNKCTDEELVVLSQKKNIDAVDILILRYMDLVKKKAKSMYIAGGDVDDLMQEGMIGFFEAIKAFKDNKGASFSTFAHLCIDRNMMSAIKSANTLKNKILNDSMSLDAEVEGDDGNNDYKGISRIDLIESTSNINPESVYLDNEKVVALKAVIKNSLSEFELQVLDLWITGQDYIAIAKLLNKEPKSIDNAIQRIRSKIRKKLLTKKY